MDIRTKLVFAYVAVALGCMLALGAATYFEVSALLRGRTLEQLDGLAEAKRDALEVIVAGWREEVATVANDASLLGGVQALERGLPRASGDLERVFGEIVESSSAVELIAVYDTTGSLLARSAAVPGETEPVVPESLPWARDVSYRGADIFAASEPRVGFTAPLDLGGSRLGMLYVRLVGEGLDRLTGAYAGLGDTGETLILARLDAGRAAVLHAVRFPGNGHRVVEVSEDSNDLYSKVLEGADSTIVEEVNDYRGMPVWAAFRRLPETGWGLVVKVDAAEELEPVVAFRGRLQRAGLSLSAFAILLGTLVGLRIAKPIHDLASVADQIRGGVLSARAEVAHEDEVGLLARTFNEMADELERRMTALQEYKKFFDVSMDMLCIAGTDGYFKQTNPSFERILGWTEEELTSSSFLEIIHPDDVEPTVRELEKLSQGIPTISFVNRFRCRNGEYKRLLWTSFPEAETGRLYAIAHEVKERDSS